MFFQRSVTKSGKGYRARYRLTPDGKWQSAPERFSKKKDANDWLDDLRVALKEGKGITDAKGGEMLLRDFAEHYFAVTTKLAKATRREDRYTYYNHVDPVFGAFRLCDIRRPAISAWAASMNGTASTQSVHHRYYNLRKMLDRAVDEGRLPFNPFPPPKKHDIKSVRKVRPARWLTDEEVFALAEAISDRYRAFVYVMAYCGLRPGEAAALRRDDINFGASTIRVDESMSHGEGAIDLLDTKNAGAVRILDQVPHYVLELLDEHLARHRPNARSRDFVFTAPDGRSNLHLINFRREWAPAVKKAELHDDPRLPSPGDLRHTAATLWIAEGTPLFYVARRLGHRSTVMVERHYGHLVPSRDSELAEAMNRRIENARRLRLVGAVDQRRSA